MPNGYYIANGWVTIAQLFATGLKIENFPTQSDMGGGRQWIRPGNEADILAPPKFVDTPTGQRFAYGGLAWEWKMQNLSPKMVEHIQNTYFPSGAGSDFMYKNWSSKLTVQTFNRATGDWEIYHTWARLGNFKGEAEAVAGGYNNLSIFFQAVAPVQGPALTATVTYPEYLFDLTYPEIATYATNDGAVATTGDIVMTYTIPDNCIFDFVEHAFGTLTYSTDNQGSWSEIAPVDLADVTNIRLTYSGLILEPTDVTETVLIYVEIQTPGLFNSVVTWFTEGQSDTSGNTDTRTETIPVFSPDLIAGMRLWVAGDENVFTDMGITPATNGQSIQYWGDKSASENNLIQGASGSRPIYRTNLLNTYGGIDFDGTDDFLDMVTNIAPFSNSDNMLFMVVNPHDTGASLPGQQYLLSIKLGTNEDNVVWAHIDNEIGSKQRVGLYLGTAWDKYAYNTSNAGNQQYDFEVDEGVESSISAPFYWRGDYNDMPTGTVSRITVGSSTTGLSAFFDGVIYEMILYSTHSYYGYRTSIYLAEKYGL